MSVFSKRIDALKRDEKIMEKFCAISLFWQAFNLDDFVHYFMLDYFPLLLLLFCLLTIAFAASVPRSLSVILLFKIFSLSYSSALCLDAVDAVIVVAQMYLNFKYKIVW